MPDMSMQSISESFPYEAADYQRWAEDDGAFARSMVAPLTVDNDTTPRVLGRSLSGILKQATRAGGGQHFSEMHLALSIMERHKLSKESFLYENYHLSAAARSAAIGTEGKKVTGSKWLDEVLKPEFFTLFDELVALNPAAAKGSHHVDLVTRDDEKKQLTFWEAKKWNPGSKKSEVFMNHQKAMLGILQHLLETRAKDVFRDPTWTGGAKLARLHASADAEPTAETDVVRTRATAGDPR